MFIGESASGNPCAVVELDYSLSDTELQQIANDAGQPVTSIITSTNGKFYIRWFALKGEINLCGHGSLGAGAAILEKYELEKVVLYSKYGEVVISKKNGFYTIVMPSWVGKPCMVPSEIADLTANAIDVFCTRDLVVVFPSVAHVKNFQPDYERIKKCTEFHALIVTAAASDVEYVLRYFAPRIGISEDLATGSAQCSLAPYWFNKLASDLLTAQQLSVSGGYFQIGKTTENLITVYAHAKLRDRTI